MQPFRTIWSRFTAQVETFHVGLAPAGRAPVALDRREVVVLIVAAVLLVVYFYYGKPSYYQDELHAELIARGTLDGLDAKWHGLLGYGYWAIAGLVLRVAIPLAIVVGVFREHPRDIGFRVRGTLQTAWIYAVLFLGMLPVLYLASLDPAFQEKYPFYRPAAEGGLHFVLFEVAYGIQFFSLEAFFRGFLLFGLYRRFGYYALLVMAVPYCMVHFGKPMPETLGAILAGLVLGYLALKAGSFYFGFLLHWGIGVAMDVLAILQSRHG